MNRQGRVSTTEKYLDALRTGEYNDVSFDLSRKSSLLSDMSKANGSGDNGKPGSSSKAQDEPEGLDRALGDAPVDDALRIEVPPAQRQVFIKTVPPSTGRAALEEVSYTMLVRVIELTCPALPNSRWVSISRSD